MHRGCLTPKQKCFQLSLELFVANVFSQRQQQSVAQTWFSDTEASVAKAGVCRWYRTCPVGH